MKKIFVLIVLITAYSYSQKQKSTKLGNFDIEELKLSNYEKDTTARALVLYEHANLYMDKKTYDFKTDYYYRKKIFKKEGQDQANIRVVTYKKEKVLDVAAISYNLKKNGTVEKIYLKHEDVFTKKINENLSETVFTLPNIKEGTVIEYVYSILSPYPGFDDWNFQSDIPKLQSDYDSAVLGNYRHKIRLIGTQKLSKSEGSVLKRCIYIDGVGEGDCAVRSYGMTDIPAFKEEEYMLSKRNYMSRLSFDYESFTNAKGIVTKYLTTWDSADKSLKKYFLNSQSNKKGFFKKRLPDYIVTMSDPLEKSKALYHYIQENYTWNGKYWSRNEKMRDIFSEKSGSVNAINLALYNSLQALGIESYVAMLSTRNHGLPTKLYPINKDFNYIVVKARINDKDYFLDATDKYLPFGSLPFKCLNGDARIMDFKNGSYWQTIKPNAKTRRSVKSVMNLDSTGELSGNILISNSGYFGMSRRAKISGLNEEEIFEDFEEKNPFLEVDTYEKNYLDTLDKPLQEIYKVRYEDEEPIASISNTRVYPFTTERFVKNPFNSEKRDYPVDFGFPRRYVYNFTLTIPENFKVTKLPDNVQLGLPNKGGSLIFKTYTNGKTINMFFSFKINKKLYSNEEYFFLKEIYNKVIELHGSFIELTKG